MKSETVSDRGGEGMIARAAGFFKGGMGQKLILAAGLIGMALILLSQFWPEQKTTAAKSEQKTITTEEYITQTETKLGTLVGGIAGAGE